MDFFIYDLKTDQTSRIDITDKLAHEKSQLGKKCFEHFSDADAILLEWACENTANYFVYKRKKCIAMAMYANRGEKKPNVFDVCVHPKYRRRGIGRKLIEYIMRTHGKIILESETEQSDSFYGAIGFERQSGTSYLVYPQEKINMAWCVIQ